MKLSDIHVRDPFILPYNGKYYLYGTNPALTWVSGQDGFDCWVSNDLINWSESIKCFEAPEGFWANETFYAPEVHIYNGEFYMFASFGAKVGHFRASQILKASNPEGPFEVWSTPITPAHQPCIDATLHIENGTPYAIYCHETIDIENKDGEILCVELTKDLKKPVGEHKILFTASEPAWTAYKKSHDEPPIFVTDGPFMHRSKDGKLLMLWASHYGPGQYIEVVSYSENGSLFGEWKHSENVLYLNDGGHGMLFKTFDGQLMFTLHAPNRPTNAETPILFKVEETNHDPFLKLTPFE
ncbi:MAG: family 43 glycosylhydrolase [Clostridia bacterium]|nr:family 43 glycosylhydrolase [Clostridia bacterium]